MKRYSLTLLTVLLLLMVLEGVVIATEPLESSEARQS